MKKRLSLLIAATLLIVPLLASAADYVIGEGDGLDIAVWGVKELTFAVKVRPDGKITVPGLGDVQASGLTPGNMQIALAARLKDTGKKPDRYGNGLSDYQQQGLYIRRRYQIRGHGSPPADYPAAVTLYPWRGKNRRFQKSLPAQERQENQGRFSPAVH